MKHSTCDLTAELVQIPYIERNAVGVVSALNAANLTMISGARDRGGFDTTLEVTHQTGLDMRSRYKETSLGGLAALPDLDGDGIPHIPQKGWRSAANTKKEDATPNPSASDQCKACHAEAQLGHSRCGAGRRCIPRQKQAPQRNALGEAAI